MRVKLNVHPAGLAALAAALLFIPGYGALAATAALLLHEGSHLLAMLFCGVKRVNLELTPFGGVADVPGLRRLSCLKQMVISLSGVAGSALGAALCLAAGNGGAFLGTFRNANLAFVLLNCMPFWPLDGARAVMALAGKVGLEKTAVRGMLWFSYGAAAFLLGLGLYGAWRGHVNPSLFILAPYLAYAAYESAACQHIRDVETTLRQGGALKPGETKPVKEYACAGEPTSLQLAALLNGDGRRVIMLRVLNQKDGSIRQTMSQADMGRKLMDQSSIL